MRYAKHRERKSICAERRDTWAEVFSALDAVGVKDGFTVERDDRLAEERHALDSFFAVKSGSDADE